MNEVINLNSDVLKRKIRKKIQDMEELIHFNDKNGNENDLITYLFILFFDTIPKNELFEIDKIKREMKVEENLQTGEMEIKKNEIIKSEKIKDKERALQIINDPEGYYEEWFDRIFSENNNNNNSKSFLKSKILQVLRGKYMEIKKKEEECSKLIKQLEELYIQDELEKKIPLTNYPKKIFKINTQNIFGNQPISGEMFARYIFFQYFYEHEKQKSSPDFFYEDNIFTNFLDSNDKPKTFSEWNPLLQFWFIYILLINRFFSKDANLDEFLKTKQLFELSRKISEWRKNGDSSSSKKKKKKDKKKKRHFGGEREQLSNNNEEIMRFKQKRSEGKLQNGKKSKKNGSMKEIYQIREVLKKTYFYKNNKIENFQNYLNEEKRKDIVYKYYSSQLGNINEININQSYPLVFYTSTGITYHKFTKQSIFRTEHTVEKNTFLSAMKENITIFQTLLNYRDENKSLFEPLTKNIRESMMMYYFALLYKKKFIYSRYLQVFDKYLQKSGLQLNELVKNTPNTPNKNQENENKENTNSNNRQNRMNNENRVVNTTHLNPSNLQKYQFIVHKIELLKEKKNELDRNKNQMNTNEKILVIEKYIRDLQLQKYQILN